MAMRISPINYVMLDVRTTSHRVTSQAGHRCLEGVLKPTGYLSFITRAGCRQMIGVWVESTASWDRSEKSKEKTMTSTSTTPCEKICQMTLKVWMKNMMLLKKTMPNCRGRWLETQSMARRLSEGEGSTEFEEQALAGMACPFLMPT